MALGFSSTGTIVPVDATTVTTTMVGTKDDVAVVVLAVYSSLPVV